jgi:hypothetical protein
MHGAFGNPSEVAKEIGGQFSSTKDRIVKSLVGPICKLCWPDNTDAHVATICGCDPRSARRYMSGEIPIPSKLMAAINVRMAEPFE